MKTLALFLAVLCFVSCQQPPSGPDLAADLKALKEAVDGYRANSTPATIDNMKAYYAATSKTMPPDMATIEHPDSLTKFMDGFKNLKNFLVASPGAEVVISSGGDLGYSIDVVTLSWEDEAGKPIVETIRDVHIWKKQADGSWKIEVDVWNEVKL
jgi:ketosteroid isomerase-like protein